MKHAKLFLVFLPTIMCCNNNLCDNLSINNKNYSENTTMQQDANKNIFASTGISTIEDNCESIYENINSANISVNNNISMKKAFVCVPVADLTGDYLNGYAANTTGSTGTTCVTGATSATGATGVTGDSSQEKQKISSQNIKYQTYETLPLESKKRTNNCKRINQALFNEIVEITGTKDNQVQVQTLNTFYQIQNPETKSFTNHSKYWAKKDNFIYLDDLKKANLDIKFIPKAIKYSSKNIEKANKNTVILKAPFYDKVTNKTYSAGTRFVKTGKNLKNKLSTQAYIFDSKGNNYEFKVIEIPVKLCAKNTTKDSDSLASKLKREEFLEILKDWANIKSGFIPYVWGGSSYTQICTKDEITRDPEFNVYTRPGFNYTTSPGLDCSGLVARAAQICNIPYFYKNTTTARNNLNKIGDISKLQAGDLIIYTGHIIIVSDIANNKIIEARTNEHGCGRVHEVALSDVFYNIKTYQDMFNLRDSKKILERIDTVGDREKVLAFDFYSLIS